MRLGRQWDERLRIWDEAFEGNLYKKLGEIALSGFVTRERFTKEQAALQSFRPFPPGTAWGEKWEYGWFRAEVTLPEEAAGKRIMLRLGAGPEMLVYVNGREAGSIDGKHAMVELTARGELGATFEIYAECYAGHGPRPENGGIYARGEISVPEPPPCQCVVGSSHFGSWDEELFRAYADYHTLYELWKALPDSELRAVKIGEALQRFTCIADFEAEEPGRRESILQGAEELRPLLEKKNGDTVPEYTVFGQSHLDLAWLWTMEETRRKSARTYSNQIALTERYPEYKFLLCCPTVLEILKEDYPGLYGRVREKVEKGQLVPEGAVYVESDTNLAGGESLIRQFVLGKRWFLREFGTDSRVAWLPDTFGFSGALPQIMAGCRVPYFATQKLLRCDPECEQFPYNVFWWEGIDGTRILSHIYKKNNAVFTPGALRERWEKDRNQKQEIDTLLFPFGYGDGGGGPTEIMVETALRCRDLEGAPRCTMESPAAFFERLEKNPVTNVYYGELYLAWHRGTYTAQAGIKKGVRRAEYALREAEYLAGLLRLAGKNGEEEETLAKLEELWRLLLLQEFHDILPGSSIQRVNEEAEEALEKVERESRLLAGKLLEKLAGKGAVFNSLSWERKYRGRMLPPCGYVVMSRGTARGKAGETNSTEWNAVRNSDGAAANETCEILPGGGLVYENQFYRARLDGRGRILSLRDRASGYEYAGEPLNEWRLYRDVNVDYDAWELGRMYEQTPEKLTGSCTFRTERHSGGGVIAVVERKEAYFSAKQEIRFFPDSSRIDFVTEVDWRERHRILKADFPTTVYTKEALEEIQFGYIRRPTHRSRQYEKDLYETCQHKYTALTDGENGIALLNDCKYGLSAEDSRLSLTLLRAPVIPDMRADGGLHRFSYSLLPFSGPFVHSRVTEEAYERNVEVTVSGEAAPEQNGPGRAAAGYAAGQESESVSFFRLEGGHAILETCKPAFDEKSGVVLRLYEAKGSAGASLLTLPPGVKRAFACNMLEEKEEELEIREGKLRLWFHAFEIKTVLLEAREKGNV